MESSPTAADRPRRKLQALIICSQILGDGISRVEDAMLVLHNTSAIDYVGPKLSELRKC